MMALQEIIDTRTYYVDTLYSKVKEEQRIDQDYIDDVFKVPEIHKPHHIYRSGLGVRIVDAPAEHIITDNPQVSIVPVKPTKATQEAAIRLSAYWNEHAIPLLQKQKAVW